MERFIPVDCFRKIGNTFRGIPFFSLLTEFLEIPVPFVCTTRTRFRCEDYITSLDGHWPPHLFVPRLSRHLEMN